MNSLDTIVLCFFVALGISIVYFLLVQFLPKGMNYVSVVVGGIIIVITAICLFFYNTQQTILKVVAGIALILLFLLIIMTVFKNRDSWRMHGIFLSHSTRIIKQRPLTILYIPIFFLMLVGFAFIVVLEFWSYWSSGTVTFDNETSLFHELEGFFPLLISIFLIIQTIWGLSFIK